MGFVRNEPFQNQSTVFTNIQNSLIAYNSKKKTIISSLQKKEDFRINFFEETVFVPFTDYGPLLHILCTSCVHIFSEGKLWECSSSYPCQPAIDFPTSPL